MSSTRTSADVLASTHRPWTRERVVGATALALATSVVAQNVVVVVTAAPDYAAPLAEVLAFHREHGGAVGLVVGLEALNLPLLLAFVVGLHGLVARRGGGADGADWSRLAVAAGTCLAAVLAVYAVLWDGTVLAASATTAPTPLLGLVWQLHAAAFALSLPALGATFLGAGLATHAAGLTPRWQRVLAVGSAVVLVATGTANLAIADGSWLLLVAMPGYAAWVVWLLATGVRLLRDRS